MIWREWKRRPKDASDDVMMLTNLLRTRRTMCKRECAIKLSDCLTERRRLKARGRWVRVYCIGFAHLPKSIIAQRGELQNSWDRQQCARLNEMERESTVVLEEFKVAMISALIAWTLNRYSWQCDSVCLETSTEDESPCFYLSRGKCKKLYSLKRFDNISTHLQSLQLFVIFEQQLDIVHCLHDAFREPIGAGAFEAFCAWNVKENYRIAIDDVRYTVALMKNWTKTSACAANIWIVLH